MEALILRLFIDANIFIAASISSMGGSYYILQACQKGRFKAVTTKLILQEAERNIKDKLDEKELKKFHGLIAGLSVEVQPPSLINAAYQNIIAPKDLHVLSAALASHCDYLITLDRKHFFTPEIKQANLSIKISTPKDFINEQR